MSYFRQQLRHERYDEIHVSPHMDDAAYSCAGRILQRRKQNARVLVVTVFGNGKPEQDAGAGGTFSDYGKRVAEELSVMRALDVDFVWLNYPELLFRKHGAADLARYFLPFMPLHGAAHDDLFESLLELIALRLDAGGTVLFPLGVGFHPDHRILFDVGRALHGLGRFQVMFYEDLPYSGAPVLRALRLSFLGTGTKIRLWAGASELNQFAFRHFGKARVLTWCPVFFYLTGLVLLRGLVEARAAAREQREARAERPPGEPLPVMSAREIADVIAQKADVMRLYASQTAFFLTLGPELVDMIKFEGESQELSWSFPPGSAPSERLSPRQRAASEKFENPR